MSKKMSLVKLIEQESLHSSLPALENVDDVVQTAALGLKMDNALRQRNLKGNRFWGSLSAIGFAGLTLASIYLSQPDNNQELDYIQRIENVKENEEYYSPFLLMTIGVGFIACNFLSNYSELKNQASK